MSTARRVVRWLLVGRRDGLRASIRRRLGWLEWLDRGRGGGGVDGGADRGAPGASPPAPRPSDPAPADGEWTDLVGADELEPGDVVEVLVGERPVAVACVASAGGRRFHALDGVCPHAGGPLGDGTVDGGQLTCPWHGWSYDLVTGRSAVDPAVAVTPFEVRERDGRVCARLTPPAGPG